MKTLPMKDLVPPKADQRPYQHKIHNDIRVDEYFWLKERENPEVIDYLERENNYYLNLQNLVMIRIEPYKNLINLGLILQVTLLITIIN